MVLSSQEQMLVEYRGSSKPPSIRLAYFYWVLTGAMGGHRFYMGKFASGVSMLFLFFVGLFTLFAGGGVAIFAIVWFWALVDAVLIPDMIQHQIAAVRGTLGLHSLASSGRLVGSNLDVTKWWHADRERYLQQNDLLRGASHGGSSFPKSGTISHDDLAIA